MDVPRHILSNVVEGGFNPDFTVGSPYLGEGGFTGGFGEVGDDYRPNFVVAEYRSRVISRKELVARDAVARRKSSASELGDAGKTSHSP
jgi:hypothetical protein